MSDKPKKEADAKGDAKGGDAHGDAPKKGGLLSKTPVLLGGAMIIEAIVLFAGMKFLGGSPKPASAVMVEPEKPAEGADAHADPHAAADAHGAEAKPAEEGHGGDAHGGGEGAAPAKFDKKARVELQVLEFRAPNKMGGRTFLYDVSIYVSLKAEHEAKVKEVITKSGALIKDRVRTIIAQSDPEKLGAGSEPGLETLRRQVKYQLDEILGDPRIIDEVLVPRCIPIPVNY